MSEPAKVVAVLVSNPALSSILSMVLASVPTLRVRPFESELALTTYMRLAPVDLIVSDFDSQSAPADRVAQALHTDRSLARRDFQVIALASEVTSEMKKASISAGIDEIIVKPMSPKYLLERVLSRLQRRSTQTTRPPGRPVRRDLIGAGENVIPLFGRKLETLH
jgi:two-component system, OmpR family, phosphate regulon response regulator PhoB